MTIPISCLISHTVSGVSLSPFIYTSPSFGNNKPFISLAIVDFPEPLCPIIATHSFWYILNEQFLSAQGLFSLYLNDTLRNSTIGTLIINIPLSRSEERRVGKELKFSIHTS